MKLALFAGLGWLRISLGRMKWFAGLRGICVFGVVALGGTTVLRVR